MSITNPGEVWTPPVAAGDVPVGWDASYLPNFLENNQSARIMMGSGAKEAGNLLVSNLRKHLDSVVTVEAAGTIQHASSDLNPYRSDPEVGSAEEFHQKLGEYNPNLLIVIQNTDFSIAADDGDRLIIDLLSESLKEGTGPMLLALGSKTLKSASVDLLHIPESERNSSQKLLGSFAGNLLLDMDGHLRKDFRSQPSL